MVGGRKEMEERGDEGEGGEGRGEARGSVSKAFEERRSRSIASTFSGLVVKLIRPFVVNITLRSMRTVLR